MTEITLDVGPAAHGGHWVARHDGRVVFVRHAMTGERVRARLTESDDGASFWRADTVEVLEPSKERRAHPWEPADALAAAVAGRPPVGGAEFGHIHLDAQRRIKADILAEQLQRLAGVTADVVVEPAAGEAPAGKAPAGKAPSEAPTAEALAAEMPDGMGWRTRMSFSVTGSGALGMHAHRSGQVLPIGPMPLAVPAINDLRLWDLNVAGLSRIEVAAPANGSMPLVLLIPAAAGAVPTAGELRRAGDVAARLPEGVSAAAWTPPSGGSKGTLTRLRGRTWVAESAAGHQYRVTGDGFWQIHRRGPDTLVDAVLGALQPGAGERAADLYAGAGLFSAPLAAAVGASGSVRSIESAAGTSRDARKNLHAYPQVNIERGKVDRLLRAAGRGMDLVVLDPPRVGAGKSVVRQLTDMRPRTVGYVSCDPASFARDVGYFRRAGWHLRSLRAFDLYPNTHHMEILGVLDRP